MQVTEPVHIQGIGKSIPALDWRSCGHIVRGGDTDKKQLLFCNYFKIIINSWLLLYLMYFSQLQLSLLIFKLFILGQWEPVLTQNHLPHPLSLEITYTRITFPMWFLVRVCESQELMPNSKAGSRSRNHYSQELAVTRFSRITDLIERFSDSSRILAFHTTSSFRPKTLIMFVL